MGKRSKGILGRTLTKVLLDAWLAPFTTKSDYARTHATTVAVAACRGWLTTYDPMKEQFTNKWRVTPEGLNEIFYNEDKP